MPKSLRARLFFNHLVVLSLGMALAAVLSWRAVERLYLETQRENLLAQAQLIAASLPGELRPTGVGEPYSQSSNVLPGIHTRVLGEEGAVVIGLSVTESTEPVQVPPAEGGEYTSPEELLRRPEIAQALQGEPSAAVRRAGAVRDRRVLYAAAPITGEDGRVSGLVYIAMPLPPAGLPAGLLGTLAAACLLAIGLASLAASLLASRLAHTVERVVRAAEAVSAGDLTQQVPVSTGVRELESLGRAFNQMTASLRRADQAKNAFVADVTHELRTPLTVIKGTIETLEDGALEDIAGRGLLLASMQRETDRLIRMVHDLLVLVRADAGKLQMRIQPVDLLALAQARCEHLAGLAAGRGVCLELRAADPPPICVLGDKDRVLQVLDNLLDNALRYSPDGATVTVGLSRQGRAWECAVRDAGPGIPAQHLPLIFERFYRADLSRNRQSGGAGLGLAIARTLVRAQGGDIAAECPAGGGTILRFSLPATEDCHPTD